MRVYRFFSSVIFSDTIQENFTLRSVQIPQGTGGVGDSHGRRRNSDENYLLYIKDVAEAVERGTPMSRTFPTTLYRGET